jgi:hypothetical protein
MSLLKLMAVDARTAAEDPGVTYSPIVTYPIAGSI